MRVRGHAAAERCPFKDHDGNQCRRPRGHGPDIAHVTREAGTSRLRIFRISRVGRGAGADHVSDPSSEENAELLAVLPQAVPPERIAVPIELYAAIAPQREYLHLAFREWKHKMRPRGSNPLAESMWRDLKDEFIRLERIEMRALSLWAETVIRVSEQKAFEYVERLWRAKLAAEKMQAATRSEPPVEKSSDTIRDVLGDVP